MIPGFQSFSRTHKVALKFALGKPKDGKKHVLFVLSCYNWIPSEGQYLNNEAYSAYPSEGEFLFKEGNHYCPMHIQEDFKIEN